MSTEPGFFGYLCSHEVILPALHVMLWVVLLLNTISYLAVEPNSSTRVVIAFNFVGIGFLLVGSGLALLKCRQLAKE